MSELRKALCTHGRVPALLMLYILLQPVLDVATSLAAEAKLPLTPGTVVRVVFLACVVCWLICSKPYEGKKRVLLYGGAITLYLAAFFAWSLAQGGLSLCLDNAAESLKVFYTLYVILFLYALWKQRGFLLPLWTVAACGAGYCLVILIAYLTGTSFASYNAGYGYSGWFYSANDISTIILLSAPVLLFLVIRYLTGKASQPKKAGMSVVAFSVVFSAAFLGTKLVYLGVLAYLAAVLVWYVIRLAVTKDKALFRGLGIVLVLCVILVGLYPVSPLNAYMSDVFVPMSGEDEAAMEASLAIEGVKEADRAAKNAALEAAAKDTWLGDLVEENPIVAKINWLLSRRLLYIAPILQEYLEGGFWIRLMGLGYGQTAHYVKDIHQLVEMEPVMMLLRHGVVGFVLGYVPVVAAVLWIILGFFRRMKDSLCDLRCCSLLFSAMVAFAASVVVGHVIQSPSVSVLAVAVYGHLLTGFAGKE